MKNLVLLIVITSLVPNDLRASDTTRVCLHPLKNGAKWGYVDNDGQCVIPFSYDSVMCFSEGLALVQVGSLWGYIDEKGKQKISPQFRLAESFSSGLAKVWLNDSKVTIAFVDLSGRIAFKCRNRDVSSFKFGRARILINNKVCYLDQKGKVAIKTAFPYGGVFYEGIAQVWSSNTAEFIDTTGKRIAFFYEMGHSDFNEGWASVLGTKGAFYLNSDGEKIKIMHRSFYIDRLGNPVLTNTIDSLVYFSFNNGMAEVCIPGSGHKSGFIDSTGKLIIPVIYDEVTPFNNGFATAWRDGKSYLLDKSNTAIELKEYHKNYRMCACQ